MRKVNQTLFSGSLVWWETGIGSFPAIITRYGSSVSEIRYLGPDQLQLYYNDTFQVKTKDLKVRK